MPGRHSQPFATLRTTKGRAIFAVGAGAAVLLIATGSQAFAADPPVAVDDTAATTRNVSVLVPVLDNDTLGGEITSLEVSDDASHGSTEVDRQASDGGSGSASAPVSATKTASGSAVPPAATTTETATETATETVTETKTETATETETVTETPAPVTTTKTQTVTTTPPPTTVTVTTTPPPSTVTETTTSATTTTVTATTTSAAPPVDPNLRIYTSDGRVFAAEPNLNCFDSGPPPSGFVFLKNPGGGCTVYEQTSPAGPTLRRAAAANAAPSRTAAANAAVNAAGSTGAAGGTPAATGATNGTYAIRYTPGRNFTGTDTFDYTVRTSAGTATATVTVDVSDATPAAAPANGNGGLASTGTDALHLTAYGLAALAAGTAIVLAVRRRRRVPGATPAH